MNVNKRTSRRREARTSKRSTRRGARVLVTVLVAIASLMAGLAGGRWLAKPGGASGGRVGAATDATAGVDEPWYTCGMHPNVLQKGPGECPICHMKLTPLKKQDDDGGAAATVQERKVLYWRSTMHPDVVSDKPGKDPMGMDLVPVYADEDGSPSAHAIRIDPVTIQNMGIRTEVIKRGRLVKLIRTVGRVDYNERLVTFVDTKFKGWIEQLYVDQTGQHVAKGQPLFDVYSPELYAAQEEYLAATRNLPLLERSTFAPATEEAARLVDAAVTKLKYLDVSEEQIARIGEAQRIEKTLTIHSPAEGIVTEKMALEGMYVMPGLRLYTIADLSRIWVYVDIYEYQLPWVYVGQPARITLPYVPGRDFLGQVVYVYPYLEPQTRVVKVRLEFVNPMLELKPGMYANVKLESELPRQALLISRAAYIDSGERKVAFVDRGNGKFQPREIQTGVEAEDGMVEVLHGLDEGEVVVTSGQFLLDAESKLKEAVAKMMEAERAKTTKRGPESAMSRDSHDHATGTVSIQRKTMPADVAYACPMEEHPDESDPAKQGPYFSAEPGKCPWCGMELRALGELAWVRPRQAAQGAEVAYTCPDHQHVFSKGGGECPRCGHPLMPFKVMYTCPEPAHADVISAVAGNCPHCGRGLAAYRGIWLDDSMAEDNLPQAPGLADAAAFRCSLHLLVHSDKPGSCTICARPLESTRSKASADIPTIPPNAKYTCPMEECRQFSHQPGECSVCGMRLEPIAQVAWVKEMRDRQPIEDQAGYVCPMHPEQVKSSDPGTCSICGMQLVHAATFSSPEGASEHVAAQVDYLTEHYLQLQSLLASDRTADVARQALALVAASEELLKHVAEPSAIESARVQPATERLRAAALKVRGENLEQDRVAFVDLSAAMSAIVEVARPSRDRWPRLYIYHCPMSKGDWVQSDREKRNPYYGFKMLTCGELKDVQ